MRKLLSKKAGAVFNSDSPNITFVVCKKSIEIVGKAKPGLYVSPEEWKDALVEVWE